MVPPVGDPSRLWLPTIGNRTGAAAAISRVGRSDVVGTDQLGAATDARRCRPKAISTFEIRPIGHRDSGAGVLHCERDMGPNYRRINWLAASHRKASSVTIRTTPPAAPAAHAGSAVSSGVIR